MTETGLNIKKRRIELGMSAEELAETIGVNPTTIYRYEKGAIDKVSAETLGEIARALYTSPVRLMDWESEAVETEPQPDTLTAVVDDLKKDVDRLLALAHTYVQDDTDYEEKKLIASYRLLSDKQKAKVEAYLEGLLAGV